MVSDSIWKEMVLIGLAILLHGVCKGLEVAILAAQKSRLQQWKETDRRGSSTAVLIGETPERFLTTIQILMTGLGIFTAALAGVVAVRDVAPWIVAQWTWPGIVFWSVPLAFALVISK